MLAYLHVIKSNNNMAERRSERAIERVIRELSNKFDVSVQLKDEQRMALSCLLDGSDVLAVLPTGYGKSLIFQLLVLVGQAAETQTSALVVCPLKSIVRDQIKEATDLGIAAGDLSEISSDDLRSSKFQLVFGAAEVVLEERVTNILKDRDSAIHSTLSAIVVDESHIVETWTGKRYGSFIELRILVLFY